MGADDAQVIALAREIDELREQLGPLRAAQDYTAIHRINNRLQHLVMRLAAIRKGIGDDPDDKPRNR